MKTIKFRAWDKTKRVMIDNKVDDRSEYDEYWGDYRAIALSVQLGDRYEVMQYTGLRDRHDVEVYEGDIVKCQIGCPHVVEWRQELGGEFGGGMPGWYLSELRSGFGKGYAWMGDEEVIGNIYQNPELLK